MSLADFVTAADEHDLAWRLCCVPRAELPYMLMIDSQAIVPVTFGRTRDEVAERMIGQLQGAGILAPSAVETGACDPESMFTGESRQTPARTA